MFFIVILNGCQKDINLNLPSPPPEVVVEGHIENSKTAYVILSTNTSYFSSFTPADISGSFVHGALITVSNGIKMDTLTELSYDTDGVVVYIYNDIKFSNPLTGQVGGTYYLDIKVDGKELTSVTTIPQLTPLDSIWYTPASIKGQVSDSLVVLNARYNSPPNPNVWVRYFTETNRQGFLVDFNSVFSNVVFAGKTFNFTLNSGINTIDTSLNLHYPNFLRGDTITLKWSNIDQAQYTFWNTLEYDRNSQGDPFANPIVVASNINGGLGIWGGYGSTYKTLIVPK